MRRRRRCRNIYWARVRGGASSQLTAEINKCATCALCFRIRIIFMLHRLSVVYPHRAATQYFKIDLHFFVHYSAFDAFWGNLKNPWAQHHFHDNVLISSRQPLSRPISLARFVNVLGVSFRSISARAAQATNRRRGKLLHNNICIV